MTPGWCSCNSSRRSWGALAPTCVLAKHSASRCSSRHGSAAGGTPLARKVYGLRSYRQNWLGSLTDAFHNLLDLLKDERFSGWYERGKGLANIEHDQGVKLASPGAALSAGLITGDEELLR